jgi:hypothetical protein
MTYVKGWQTFALSILTVLFYQLGKGFETDVFYMVAIVCFIFAFVTGILKLADIWLEAFDRYQISKNTTARAIELEKAARLSDEQAKAVPAMAYHAVLGMALNRNGEWEYLLQTKDGSIPYHWTQKFLLECSATRLRSIRSYSNGTQAQHYAQWFTAWLREQNYVIGGEDGSGKVAEWINEKAYFQVRELFRLKLDDHAASPSDNVFRDPDYDEPIGTDTRVFASES